MEKQKLVYVMNRDAGGRLTISSPLEAHKSHAIVYSSVGLDVGTENPIFASIEKDYSEADQVMIPTFHGTPSIHCVIPKSNHQPPRSTIRILLERRQQRLISNWSIMS